MGIESIKEIYKSWSIRAQLEIFFVLTAFIFTAIILGMTRIELDYLRDVVLGEANTVTYNQYEFHAKAIAKELAGEAEEFLKSAMNYVSFQRDLTALMAEGPAIPAGTVHMHNEIPASDFDEGTTSTSKYGVFFCRNEISPQGEDLMNKVVAMDKVWTKGQPHYVELIYSGFEQDELFYYYKGEEFKDENYSPLVREWYYKAYEQAGSNQSIIMTEPYKDALTGKFLISVSEAIVANGQTIGVTSIDISLEFLSNEFSSIKFLETGFALLVSKSGLVVARPEFWTQEEETVRIYDEDITGISESIWESIRADEDLEKRYDYTGTEGKFWMCYKNSVRPYLTNSNVTHYAMVCFNEAEAEKPIDTISESFSDTYTLIFWVVVGIGLLVFILIVVLIYIYSKSLGKDLRIIERTLDRIAMRGLFVDITKEVHNYYELPYAEKNMKELVVSLEEKIHDIKSFEHRFIRFYWGPTRPNDELVHDRWLYRGYAVNSDKPRFEGLREVIAELNTQPGELVK